MTTLVKFIIALTLAILHTVGLAQETTLATTLSKFDTYAKELNYGAATLAKKNNKIETAGFGNFNLNAHSVFNIGSATKTITAILILQEEEKGSLSINDTIGSYLPQFKNVDGKLTIKQLLKHESGLGEVVGADYEKKFYEFETNKITPHFSERIPAGNPEKIGTYTYTNTNYLLLGLILQKVTDLDYFDLVRERIFKPCKMTESYAYISKSIENLAHPTNNGKDIFENLHYQYFAKEAHAAGSVASTLIDMEKFYTHLYEQNTLLSTTSFEKMIDFGKGVYGLGIIKYNTDDALFIGHGGDNIGYTFRNYYNPKTKNLILYFGNQKSFPFKGLLKSELMDYLDGKESTIVFNTDVAKDFEVAVGTYFFKEMNVNVAVISEENNLYLGVQGAKLLLVSYTANILSDTVHGITLELNTDNKNALTFRQNGMEAVITKVEATKL